MAEFLDRGERRTCYCGDLRESDIGREVCLMGWVGRQRDLGSLIFIDLRDRSGIVQLAFGEDTPREVFDKAFTCRAEFVLAVHGTVRRRGGAVNPALATGSIEVAVSSLKILSAAHTPPIEVSDTRRPKEDVALRYRYIDLRRPALQRNLRVRHEIARAAREYFTEQGFLEIETPMLIKPTPEGARDYVVPSRLHPGSLYALPQSPQIYKQLLMVAGFDRYFQLARCFRDEDLRADRQPEFTQIDMEMSFTTEDEIMEVNEGLVARVFRDVLGVDLPLPLPRMTYAEAMERFGTDKPDTRFGMELQDLSDVARDCGFSVFEEAVKSGGSVRAIVAKGAAGELSRKDLDKLTEHARGIGARGLATIRQAPGSETPNCSFSKFLKEGALEAILGVLGFERGDVALLVADRTPLVLSVLGKLRVLLGKKLSLAPEGVYRFVWITEFPFFEWNEETRHWDAMHHPFTMPLEECLPSLRSDPGSVRARCYDLVLNGVELLSGSMRITDPALQQTMFEALGMGEEEIEAKFGFLVEAYKYGAPPHGGAAMGLDRLAMLLTGAESLRDVVAFPKVQNASEPMSGCPAPADESALSELGLRREERQSEKRE